jgi:sterol desaturase/sphingolipid hydroxylase (fatty acid hydroxylase superfamily)
VETASVVAAANGLPLREAARAALGPCYGPLRDLFWSAFAFTERTTAVWIAAYVLLAFAVYAKSERKAGEPLLAGFRRYLLPRAIYAHPSAKADYLYFVVDKLVFFGGLAALAGSGGVVTSKLLLLLPAAPRATPSLWASILLTVLAFVAFDLGAFVWHYLTHRVQVLWAFHRVHHAAEVLTPLSNYREHPVDTLGRSLVQGALVGAVEAALLHSLPSAKPLEVCGVNALYLPFFVFANARHSHVWVSFGRFWSHLFNSPAQHQCHHGTDSRHIDVNYGLVLSIWDWMAGSLYVPLRKEEVRYGLVGEERPFPTLSSMYLRPFRDAWLRLRRHSRFASSTGGSPRAALCRTSSSFVNKSSLPSCA